MIDLLTAKDIDPKTEVTRVNAMTIGHTGAETTDTKRVGGHPFDPDSMKGRRVVRDRGVLRGTQTAMTERAVANLKQRIKRDQLKRGGTHLKERGRRLKEGRHHLKS